MTNKKTDPLADATRTRHETGLTTHTYTDSKRRSSLLQISRLAISFETREEETEDRDFEFLILMTTQDYSES
jgi:hypothetical protein